jgi:hypothetical protein
LVWGLSGVERDALGTRCGREADNVRGKIVFLVVDLDHRDRQVGGSRVGPAHVRKLTLFGGLVFQRLTAEYLRIWGEHWWDKAPKELLHLYYAGLRRPEQQEVIVLAQVLADAVNVGYEPFTNDVVATVDGAPPVDMRDFVAKMDAAQGEVVLKLTSGATVLLAADAARASLPRILKQYHVPGDRSQDLVASGAGKPRRRAAKRW